MKQFQKFWRYFLIIALIQNLLPLSIDDAVAARSGSASGGQQTVKNYLDALTGVPLIPDFESRLGQIADNAQGYLRQHPKDAATENGRELANVATKTQNYLKLKKNLNSCAADKRDLKDRLLAVASTLDPKDNPCTCSPKGDAFSGLAYAVKYSVLEDQANKNAIVTAVDKYYEFKIKFGDGNISNMNDTLCGGKCSAEDRALMDQRLAQLQSKYKNNPFHKLDAEHEFFTVNNKLRESNKYLEMMTAKPSSDPNKPDKNRDLYNAYQQKYYEAMTSDAGILLGTKAFADYFGPKKTVDNDMELTMFLSREFTPHHVWGDGKTEDGMRESGEYGPKIVMNNAIKEANEIMLRQFQDIAQKDATKQKEERGGGGFNARNPDKSREDLMDMVDSNPVALAQVLLSNPAASGEICEMIKMSDQRNEHRQRVHTVALWTTGIIGVGLLVTGIFAHGGVALLTIAAAGAVTSTVGTVDAYQQYAHTTREYNALQGAMVSGTSIGDVQSANETRQAMDAYYGAKTDLYVNGLGLIADGVTGGVGAIKVVRAAGKTAEAADAGAKTMEAVEKGTQTVSRARTVEEVQTATEVMNEVKAANSDGKLVQAAEKMSHSAGAEETKGFFAGVTKAKKSLREKLFQWMKGKDEKTLEDLAKKVNKAAKDCG